MLLQTELQVQFIPESLPARSGACRRRLILGYGVAASPPRARAEPGLLVATANRTQLAPARAEVRGARRVPRGTAEGLAAAVACSDEAAAIDRSRATLLRAVDGLSFWMDLAKKQPTTCWPASLRVRAQAH